MGAWEGQFAAEFGVMRAESFYPSRGHRVVVGSLLSTLIILNIAFHKKGFTSEVSVASYFGDGNSRRSFSSFPLCVCDNVKQDIEKYKAFYRRAVPFLDLFCGFSSSQFAWKDKTESWRARVQFTVQYT